MDDPKKTGFYDGVQYFKPDTEEQMLYTHCDPENWAAIKKFHMSVHDGLLDFSDSLQHHVGKDFRVTVSIILNTVSLSYAHSFVAAGAAMPAQASPMEFARLMGLANKLFNATVRDLMAQDFLERVQSHVADRSEEPSESKH
jgi:hypothetical protein